MSVLTDKEVAVIKKENEKWWMGKVSTYLSDCIDTIADRDKQIQGLWSRVEGLEGQTFSAQIIFQVQDGILICKQVTSGAVKEPTPVLEDEMQQELIDAQNELANMENQK